MAKQAALRIAAALIGIVALTANAGAQQEIKPFGKRIIGCEKTVIEEHPWQVAFDIKFPNGKAYLCGGSIIAHKWVLTAAHCFHKSGKPSDARVKSGVTNIVWKGSWAPIERIIRHENFDPNTLENDIALVKLKLKPRGNVIPPSRKDLNISVGQTLEVTGWGITEKGTTSDNLCKTSVPYIDNAKCNEKEAYDGDIGPGMMCAGYPKGGKDACAGDSGGPLVWHSPDGAILVGVVSSGEGCAEENKPGVYSRVSVYRDWISSTIVANGN